jgi:hypothetical protein
MGTSLAGEAHAQPASPACGSTGRPWIAVHAAADLPRTVNGFVDLLRAELASRGIDLCTETPEAGAAAPIATIDLSTSPDEVTLGVEVHDAVTEKHVSREVRLRGVPPDSRPLTIALAADELLRASWAELALRSVPPPPRPVPVEVTRTVRESVAPVAAPPAAQPRVLLGVDGAFEHFASGTSLYGVDARFAAWLVPRFAVSLRVGLRSGTEIDAADGEVQTAAWLAGVGAQVTLTPPELLRWGIDAVAHFDVEHVSFTPTPGPSAVGTPASYFTLVTGLGAQAWLRVFSTLRVGAQAVALLPLRPVEAADNNVAIAGVSGVGIGALLGVWSTL